MKYNFQLFFILLVPYTGKIVLATTNTTNVSSVSSHNSNENPTENILTRTVTPKTEKKFDIGALITLFTKPTTTTSTTTTTTPSPGTNNGTNTTTTCQCGKGAKPRSIEEFVLEDKRLREEEQITKIVNGTVSNNHGWPWVVALVNESSPSPRSVICGGSLISKDYILTAAHCLPESTASKAAFIKNFRVYLGANKINGKSNRPPVKALIGDYKIHPKYSTVTFQFDVAIIKLATSITFNSSISPVCLSQTGKPFGGKNATAVGWGGLYSNQNGSNVLREVGLTVIGNSVCNATTTGNSIGNTNICAKGNPAPKGICRGDSGGGLYYLKPTAKTYTIIGISSRVVPNGCSTPQSSPSVFTRVSSVIDFIKAYTMNSTTYCTNTFFP